MGDERRCDGMSIGPKLVHRVLLTNMGNGRVQLYSAFNTIKFHFICITLNHHFSLKGLNRPNIYDITLTRLREKKLP